MVYPFHYIKQTITVVLSYSGNTHPDYCSSQLHSTMAQQVNFDDYLAIISLYTYEQLEHEQARLRERSAQLAQSRRTADADFAGEVALFNHIIDGLNESIDQQMERMAHQDYLDHIDAEQHIQEQHTFNHLLNLREEMDAALETCRRNHRREALFLNEQAREIFLLSALATWAHLIKIERQDLV